MLLFNYVLKNPISLPPSCLSVWYAQSVSLPVFFIAFQGTYFFSASPTYVLALPGFCLVFLKNLMEIVSLVSGR